MINRRDLLVGGGTAFVLSLVPMQLAARETNIISRIYGSQPIEQKSVSLSTPALAENGNSVSLTVEVESPMTEDDYIEEIRLYAPKNPEPELVVYKLSPAAGKASVSTRIRLADSQIITAVAKRNDGQLFSASSETIITLAACVEPLL